MMSSASKLTNIPNVDIITYFKSKYEVLEFVGEGLYGKVAMGRNRASQELVALKFMKKHANSAGCFNREMEMLGHIRKLDPDSFNLIKCIDFFTSEDQQCLVFEMLDISVEDLMQEALSFSLSQIRTMAKQLLKALYGLQSVGVIHTDIKPDNIMLANHKEQPFKVKLIDFGLARCSNQVIMGQHMQPIDYRAPEVMLGLPLSEAVDMWSLACCLIYWYLGSQDFIAWSDFEYMSKIVHFLGKPADELLNDAKYTWKYFVHENSEWRLMGRQEFKETTGVCPEMSSVRPSATNLEQLIKVSTWCESDQECNDREAFLDLLRRMFEMDPELRITPPEALLHPFITMDHLPDEEQYTKVAHELMQVVEMEFKAPQQENIKETVEWPKLVIERTAKNTPLCDSDDGIFFNVDYSNGNNTCEPRFIQNEIQSQSLEEDSSSKTKIPHNIASDTAQSGPRVEEAEDMIVYEEPLEADETKILQDELKNSLDIAAILDAVKKDCSVTEALSVNVNKKASRSIFGRCIPRPLPVLVSKSIEPCNTSKKNFFKTPKWVKRFPVFTSRSNTSRPLAP